MCPRNCNAQLLMMERLGVEIDYCPNCRGVWLDRGELDKIMEKVEDEVTQKSVGAKVTPTEHRPPNPSPSPSQHDISRPYEKRYDDDDDYKKNYDPRYGYKKKRKSSIFDIFDF